MVGIVECILMNFAQAIHLSLVGTNHRFHLGLGTFVGMLELGAQRVNFALLGIQFQLDTVDQLIVLGAKLLLLSVKLVRTLIHAGRSPVSVFDLIRQVLFCFLELPHTRQQLFSIFLGRLQFGPEIGFPLFGRNE